MEQQRIRIVREITLGQPKKNCKKCHGTGRIGYLNGDFNNPIRCHCREVVTETKEEIVKDEVVIGPILEVKKDARPEDSSKHEQHTEGQMGSDIQGQAVPQEPQEKAQ